MDDAEIKSLLVKERFARDTAQWAKLRSLYHPESSRTKVHTMWHNGDIDGFIAGSEKLHTTTGAVIHQLVPADVQIAGSKAVADCWCFISARIAVNNHDYELKTCLRLLYKCEKVAGVWKILTLEPIYTHDMITPVPPAPNLEFPDMDQYRQSYKFTAWAVQQRGVSVANDLPGEDDAESVRDIQRRHQDWLVSN